MQNMDNHPFRGPCTYQQDGAECRGSYLDPIHLSTPTAEVTEVEQVPVEPEVPTDEH